MEIRIGMKNVNRELTLDVDAKPEDITKQVEDAIKKSEHLVLEDSKNNTYIVAGQHIAYVELGEARTRQVGFVR